MKSKRNRTETESKSMWHRADIEVRSKWYWSEGEVTSKSDLSVIKVTSKSNRGQIKMISQWNQNEIEVNSNWISLKLNRSETKTPQKKPRKQPKGCLGGTPIASVRIEKIATCTVYKFRSIGSLQACKFVGQTNASWAIAIVSPMKSKISCRSSKCPSQLHRIYIRKSMFRIS